MDDEYRYVLGVDPSGNHSSMGEGNGHSAFALYDRRDDKFLWTKDIKASDYDGWYAFWQANVKCIADTFRQYSCCVSLEDYRMYGARQAKMGGQRNPTLMLLGIFWYLFETQNMPWVTQMYKQCRNEIDDDCLVEWGYLTLTVTARGANVYRNPAGDAVVEHERDAMAHALYCAHRLKKLPLDCKV